MTQDIAALDGWTIVFDLDGTLVDTAPDLTHAVNHILTSAGRRPISTQDLGHLVGRGAKPMIERGFAMTGAPLDQAAIDDHLATFLDFYGANLTAAGSAPFDGIEQCLQSLADRDIALSVCTNKTERFARALLADLALDHHFHSIVGGDRLPVKKPDPAMLTLAVEEAGGDPTRAILIGDSISDVGAARAANIPVVLVSFGYTDIPVAELGGNAIIDHFDQLPSVCLDLARPVP